MCTCVFASVFMVQKEKHFNCLEVSPSHTHRRTTPTPPPRAPRCPEDGLREGEQLRLPLSTEQSGAWLSPVEGRIVMFLTWQKNTHTHTHPPQLLTTRLFVSDEKRTSCFGGSTLHKVKPWLQSHPRAPICCSSGVKSTSVQIKLTNAAVSARAVTHGQKLSAV